MRGAWLALFVSAFGCRPGIVTMTVVGDGLPEDAVWIAAAFEGDGAAVYSTGLHRRGDDEPVWVVADSAVSTATTVHVVAYTPANLSCSGLPGEEILRADPIRRRASTERPLAAPAWYATGAVRAEGTAITAATNAPRWTSDWINGAVDTCSLVALDVERVALGGERGAGTFVLALGDGSLLVGTDTRSYYLVDATSAVRMTEISTAATFRAALLRDDGTIWLAGQGKIARGRLDAPFETLTQTYPAEAMRMRMSGAPSGELELFITTDEGTLLNFDGTVLTTLVEPRSLATRNDVLWLGAGRALAVFQDTNELIRVANGMVTIETLPVRTRPRTIADVPGLGPLIGGADGSIYRSTRAGWVALPESPIGEEVRRIAPLDEGLIYAVDDGLAGLYFPNLGFCPPTPIAGADPTDMVAIANGVAIVEDARPDEATSITIARVSARRGLLGCVGR